ncbi:hypothetical protein Ddye_020828 [Dipteronia dyeriana]|uniref:Uncharacterized protein n=1 Tax=Dipteronia dyeriana TaxID=168575 RepID=A0AAD9WWY2_9ROSI|nr:hypothetical protein Ddye_020828 [Dipteronia dyeriana]
MQSESLYSEVINEEWRKGLRYDLRKVSDSEDDADVDVYRSSHFMSNNSPSRSSVRASGGLPCTYWERVKAEDPSREERNHISTAWTVSSARRQIGFLLDDRNLYDLGIVPALLEDKKKTVERNLEKKRKLAGGAKKMMADKRKDTDKKKKRRIPQVGDRLKDLYVHDPKISPNYFINPPATEFDLKESPITPKTGTELVWSYGKNILRSRESVQIEMVEKYEGKRESFEKLKQKKSKVDNKCLLAQGKYELLKTEIIELNSRYRKGKADGRNFFLKLYDYRQRIEAANKIIRGMTDDLGDNAVDLFLASEEFYSFKIENFDRVVEELEEMLLRSYLEFDFSAFDAEV